MSLLNKHWLGIATLCGTLLGSAQANDTLFWSTNQNRVTADIRSADLFRVLEGVSAATGWKVFVEPETKHRVSAKFKDLGPGEALHLLLGNVNFALLPETNGRSKLLVFQTSMTRATQLVLPAKLGGSSQASGKPIPGELIVRLKPGMKIEDLAKALGAKVIGKIDSLNAFRLKFDDQAAAEAGKEQLAGNPDVASVEDNYSIGLPTSPQLLASGGPPPPHLDLKPPPDTGNIIVGLADTALQPLGNGLDAFILKQLSVAGDANLDPNSLSHGTAVAETILRSLESVTKGSTSVQILPVDIYGPNASTTTFDGAQGVALLINKGAKVINMSFGGVGDSPLMHDVITEGSAKGIVFIAAAGNDASPEQFYPAAYADNGNVFAVTAVSNGKLAPYANYGDFVSLAAPGTSIVTYNNQSYYVMGTSVSAPYVSGWLAGQAETTHTSLTQAKTALTTTFGYKPPGK